MRRSKLIRDTVILSISSLLMRATVLSLQAWLAGHIGAGGIGLNQLIGSVTILFSTFAVSGIHFASTRLISEEAGLRSGAGVTSAVRHCAGYALFFGVCSACLLWLHAKPLGFLWLQDARTVFPLKITATGLPIIALSSVLSGYFTSTGRVWKAAALQLAEQMIAVFLVIVLLHRCDPLDLEAVCTTMAAGNVIAGAVGLALAFLAYCTDRKRWSDQRKSAPHLTGRMLRIALPLAFSSYTRTALSTIQHLMVPRGLRLSGMGAAAALSGYGIVHGMALPAVLFPSCLLLALTELLVPAITQAQVQKSRNRMFYLIGRARKLTLLYAVCCSALLAACSKIIADRVFHTPDAANYILLLAPLIPVMNLDTVTDGCLRGLGKQTGVMLINILDAAFGVALVCLLLPRYGLRGYVAMIWTTECMNLALSTIALQIALKQERASGS